MLAYKCITIFLFEDIGHFQEPPTTPCGDLSASDCRDPLALKTICSDCETAEYCRKSCGLCHGKC